MEAISSCLGMDPWRRRTPCARGTSSITGANATTRTVASIIGI